MGLGISVYRRTGSMAFIIRKSKKDLQAEVFQYNSRDKRGVEGDLYQNPLFF
jgi:hypothetical protein